jgi:hypothetical protein
MSYAIAFAVSLLLCAMVAFGHSLPKAPEASAVAAPRDMRTVCANIARITGGGYRDFERCLTELGR